MKVQGVHEINSDILFVRLSRCQCPTQKMPMHLSAKMSKYNVNKCNAKNAQPVLSDSENLLKEINKTAISF